MTTIEFYLDPSCPFCWITSRWLLQVSAERAITVSWRQFSLALKNNELAERQGEDKHASDHRAALRVQRVIYQAVTAHGASLIDLYSEFGIRFHIMERPFDDEMIKEVLEAKNLPAELSSVADDTSLDTLFQAEIDSAIEAAGRDIGVPTIVFTDKNGQRVGYYGPILDTLPETLEDSLQLWDGLEKLATTPGFYELKRSRSGKPNVFIAAIC